MAVLFWIFGISINMLCGDNQCKTQISLKHFQRTQQYGGYKKIQE